MILNCQQNASNELQKLSTMHRQSILIDGPQGCGKTYLASKYASMLQCSDFITIHPTIDDIRTTIEACYQVKDPVVVCIENLDTGVVGASYALLKFLEEPYSNIYIIVTCRNVSKIPDTIVSRSCTVTVSDPTQSDIVSYAETKYSTMYSRVSKSSVWKCADTFQDVDIMMMFSDSQLDYFNSLNSLFPIRDSVSNLVWKLGHFDDNSESPVELVMRYLMSLNVSTFVKQCCISCIQDLASGRIAKHAVLSKFCFDVKYCE